jgi:hypothetical protein
MKEMSWYQHGVVTQSLRGGSPAECPILNHAIECTRPSKVFNMYARYGCHDDATLSSMEDSYRCFHSFKDVVLIGRAGNRAKPKYNALRMDLVKMQKVNEETNAETWTLFKKGRKMYAWWEYNGHKTDNSKGLDADFNLPMIRLMFHWVKLIRRY